MFLTRRSATVFTAVLLFSIAAGCSSMTSDEVDDESIRRQVAQVLAGDYELSLHQIGVSVAGGTVYLQGQVATSQQRRRAEELARGVEGVLSVRNGIRVGNMG